MIIKDWMSAPWTTMSAETTLPDAVRFMNQRSAPGVVVTSGGLPGGAVTRSEAYEVLENGTTFGRKTLATALAPGLPRLSADDPLERAARFFGERRVGALAVWWKDTLAGVLTPSDVCRAYCLIMGSRGADAPLTMLVSAPRGSDVIEEIRRRTGGALLQGILAYPTPDEDWQIQLRMGAHPKAQEEDLDRCA
jgi:hypothetical protein